MRAARRHTAAILAVAIVLLGSVIAPSSTPAATAASWSGAVDLYRSSAFTTQKTWLWCTAADVQIIRNIVRKESDHSRANQQRYFDYMRAHNRYEIPVKDGVDPAGWAAGLRHYVDARYRLVASPSFDSALRSAVANLRRTNRPVGITVSHGNHAWIVTGFSATADPAVTTRFTVTSVRVVGPLWGLQSRAYGYDMRPNTKLTPAQLRGFFTPWHYAGVKMAWEGRWVSIQPVAAAAAPSPTPKSTPKPTSKATAIATPAPPPSATPEATPEATPVATPVDVAAVDLAATAGPADQPPSADSGLASDTGFVPSAPLLALLALAVVLAAGVLGMGLRASRRR